MAATVLLHGLQLVLLALMAPHVLTSYTPSWLLWVDPKHKGDAGLQLLMLWRK